MSVRLTLKSLHGLDAGLAALALVLMALIPLIEILVRPVAGSGVQNAPVVVQHLGLVMAMLGSVAALRNGHLSSFGKGFASTVHPRLAAASQLYGKLFAALICGLLCMASAQLVNSERQVAQTLAYGIPVWWLQASMPLGSLEWAAARPERVPPLPAWVFFAEALRLDRDGGVALPLGRDAPDRPAGRLVAVVTVQPGYCRSSLIRGTPGPFGTERPP